jgi:hypothetical protein
LFVIYTAGQQFASLVAANPVEFSQDRFVVSTPIPGGHRFPEFLSRPAHLCELKKMPGACRAYVPKNVSGIRTPLACA